MTETKTQQPRESAELKAHREQEAVVNTRVDQYVHGDGERVESVEDADKKGYFGVKVDPRPDSHYTHPAHKG